MAQCRPPASSANARLEITDDAQSQSAPSCSTGWTLRMVLGLAATSDHVPPPPQGPPSCSRNPGRNGAGRPPGSTWLSAEASLAALSAPWTPAYEVTESPHNQHACSCPREGDMSATRQAGPPGTRAHLPPSHAGAGRQVPFLRPRIHMVSRASTSVRPRPNHSLKDLDTGFSSSWPQANLRYPAHAWRKASMTACWRSFGEAAGEAGQGDRTWSGRRAPLRPPAGRL